MPILLLWSTPDSNKQEARRMQLNQFKHSQKPFRRLRQQIFKVNLTPLPIVWNIFINYS